MLFKEIVDARTDARTHARTMDDGQWAITKAHLEHVVLRWAKNSSGARAIIKFAGDLQIA